MTITTSLSDRAGEVVHRTELAGGLPALLLQRPGWAHRYAVLATSYGSSDETFSAGDGPPETTPAGLAHFLEHTLFKDEEGDAMERFSRLGAASNAFTGRALTAYLFSTTDRFDEGLDLLIDFVGGGEFPADAVERERSVIAQEIRMYEDDPGWRSYQGLLEALYVKHPVRTDIAGTVESIGRITPEILRRSYRAFYNPRNMVLAMAGDLDPSHVFGRAEEALGRSSLGGPAPIARIRPADEPRTPRVGAFETSLVVARPRAYVGWKDPEARAAGDALQRKEIEVRLLLDLMFGRGSSFFQEHVRSGLIDDSFGHFFDAGTDYGVAVVGGETDDPAKLEAAIRAEMALFRARPPAVLAEDLSRVQRKEVGRFIRSLNSMEWVVHQLAVATFEGVDIFRHPEVLGGVTPESVHARLHAQLADEGSATSVIRPRAG